MLAVPATEDKGEAKELSVAKGMSLAPSTIHGGLFRKKKKCCL